MKRSDISDEHVLELARAWRQAPLKNPGALDALIDEGVPVKVAVAKIEHMVSRRLLNYGVSVRYPWPR